MEKMNTQKGFSLLEVILSLTLTTSVLFFVLELYRTSFLFFNHTFLRVQASAVLDTIDDLLLLGEKVTSPIDSCYELEITQDNTYLKLALHEKKQNLLLIRHYEKIKVLQ